MKTIILILAMFVTLPITAQTKIETFCLENDLTISATKESYTIAKQMFTEQATMFPATYSYTIEVTYTITDKEIKLITVKNTSTSNNGFILDFENYRGALKENITKKAWEKLKERINQRCQTLTDKY